MPRIVDYASLVQGILDFTHRATLAPFVDYLIQGAQEQIANDIIANNFGEGIRLMETAYGPISILANGTAPVPSDWIAPKVFTLSQADDQFDLIFKDPKWIYSRYPRRQASGTPAYIARDTYAPNGSPSGLTPYVSLTAGAGGQIAFSLAGLNRGSVVLVSVNGVVLTSMADYRLSGNTLILTNRASDGEPVFVVGVPAGFDALPQVFTATAGQTNFTLSNPGTVLFVALNGGILNSDGDYSITGSTLTLSSGAVVGQTLIVSTSVALTDAGKDEIFVEIDGQTDFILAAPAGSQVLFAALDGVTLSPSDYSINGAALTLTSGAIAGQVLIVRYVSTGLISANSAFIFGPFPDDAYTVQGTYYQVPPTLSSSQTTNWLVLSAPMLLHSACMVEAGKFLKDVAMVEGWSQVYEGKLTDFIGRDSAERYGGGPLVINAA